MKRPASYWIEKLQMLRHIEGGSYSITYTSDLLLPQQQLPSGFKGARPASTAIYFLLDETQFSAMHRIASDEVWHFYYGDPLVVYEIEQSGTLTKHLLGNNPDKTESFQCVVKAGSWFGAKTAPGASYSLVGCTVAPGFNFDDFELADRHALTAVYPQHAELIKMLTRG